MYRRQNFSIEQRVNLPFYLRNKNLYDQVKVKFYQNHGVIVSFPSNSPKKINKKNVTDQSKPKKVIENVEQLTLEEEKLVQEPIVENTSDDEEDKAVKEAVVIEDVTDIIDNAVELDFVLV